MNIAINIFLVFTLLLCVTFVGLVLYVVACDWGSLAPWSTYKAPGMCLALVLTLVVVSCVISHRLYERLSPPEQPFQQWIDEHMKTCPTCRRATDTAESAICEEAFVARLQDEFRTK